MTIKLILLKSGEDVIADVSEMIMGEGDEKRVIGYHLDKPCVIRMKNPNLQSENGSNKKAGFEVSLFPWLPLTPETKIPITADWLITMVEPTAKLKEMYIEDVLSGPDSKDSSSDDKSDSDN